MNNIKFIICICSLYLFLFATTPAQLNSKNQFFNYDKNTSTTTITNNLPKATNDVNTSNWNLQDWKKSFEKHGLSNATPANTQMLFSGKMGQAAFSGNVNNLTTKSITQNSSLKNINSIKNGWNDSIKDKTISNATSNPYISAMKGSKDIKCYITRDIPFIWKCKATGLSYGGGINESGKHARLECENNCYQQRSCTNLNPHPIAKHISISDLTCDFKDNNCTKTIDLDNTKIVKNLTFNIENNFKDKNNDNDFRLKLIETDNNNSKITILNVNSQFLDFQNISVNINKSIKNLTMQIIPTLPLKNSDTTKIKIDNMKINYAINNKYICVYLQNIYGEKGDNYAYTCPDGKTTTFQVGNRDYEICSDGKIRGDNPDGTFSTLNSCEAICREASPCEIDQATFNTKLLYTFREGCIRGQSNCKDSDCRNARLLGDTIINETVFDASFRKYTTIQNTIQNHNVERPRVSLQSDLSFQKRSEQEWKDKAFENMAKNSTYSEVTFPIGGDSEASSAYSISMVSGAAYGIPNIAVRTLFWELKPKASDVYNDINYYFYMLLSVQVGYKDYNLDGQLEQKRKIIWYMKTSKNSDTFKPVRIAYDTGYAGLDDQNNTIYQKTQYSVFKDMTFSGTSWIPISSVQSADYFNVFKFDATKYYWRIPVINNLGNLIYNLPGLIRSKTYDSNGIVATNHYNGKFDGTGDGILSYKVYTIYSKSILTYQEIFNMIENQTIQPIYALGQGNMYPRDVKFDSLVSQPFIQIYQYGSADKTSVFARILPKKKDIGQKGFIFVFMQ